MRRSTPWPGLHAIAAVALLALACPPAPKPAANSGLDRVPAVAAAAPAAGPAAEQRRPYFLRDRSPTSNRRIVSMAPSVTEILFALGAGDRVVGVTRFCDFPAAAAGLPKIGGFLDPSLEAIAGLRPDLIIAVPNGSNRPLVERLADLGLSLLLVYDYELADLDRAIPAIGAAIGRSDAAAALLERMHGDAAAIRAAVAGRDRPRVLFLYGRKPLVAAGPGSYADALIEIAGGRNALGAAYPRYATIPLETVAALAPDVVIDAYAAGHGAASEPLDLGRLADLPAVRNHRVYALSDNAALRPGPRVGADARIVAALLHPGIEL
ncbi:MAG: ABC transporter substrate-binding protein [Deltaproteobacteria bacterium]|nr:ABC transporter substrate-binding protein [Deltaproteobacteria bacterium]